MIDAPQGRSASGKGLKLEIILRQAQDDFSAKAQTGLKPF
jgi:hypothetical protein